MNGLKRFSVKGKYKDTKCTCGQKLQVKKMTLKLSLAVIQKNWMVVMLLLPEVKTGMSHPDYIRYNANIQETARNYYKRSTRGETVYWVHGYKYLDGSNKKVLR